MRWRGLDGQRLEVRVLEHLLAVTVYAREPGGPLYARVWDRNRRSGRGGLRRGALALLTLGLGVGTAAAQAGDEWSVSPEEIAAAESARLFQSDDVLELTLFADFNAIEGAAGPSA